MILEVVTLAKVATMEAVSGIGVESADPVLLIDVMAATVNSCCWVGVNAPALFVFAIAERASKMAWAGFVLAVVCRDVVKEVVEPEDKKVATPAIAALVTIEFEGAEKGPRA